MARKVSYEASEENRAENAAFWNSGQDRYPVGVLPIENDSLGSVAEIRFKPAICKSSDVERVFLLTLFGDDQYILVTTNNEL